MEKEDVLKKQIKFWAGAVSVVQRGPLCVRRD